MLQSSVFQKFLMADPFWIREVTTDPYIPAPANTECPEDTYLKLYIYISKLV